MNLSSHSERKCGLETESKPEIEGIHLHHKDMSNQLNYTSNPMDLTISLHWVKVLNFIKINESQ